MIQQDLSIEGINANQVIERFCYEFQPDAKFIIAKGDVHVYIIERFFLRSSSDISATILFELKNTNHLGVHITIAGGGNMYGITFGAQNSLLKKLRKFFTKLSDKTDLIEKH
ncbi:MAG: hypothetical protein HWN79_03680 [Candidatus Lokiarchaeota archaeon]|nr:hypothetical protein [Candidatus Lokiarchaeota archaeon]